MSKGDQTREKIIAKAAELFNQRGLEGTSMADLMEATGLEKGGIYRHFPSKEAVAAEAFDYAWVRLLRHRQTKGPGSARPHLHRRATPRLHLIATKSTFRHDE
jgi:AcrR family transcriptional regulator